MRVLLIGLIAPFGRAEFLDKITWTVDDPISNWDWFMKCVAQSGCSLLMTCIHLE